MKRLKLYQSLLIIATTIALQSCGVIFSKMMGMKKMKHLSSEKILKQGNKYNIPKDDLYVLNVTYMDYISSLDTNKFKTEKKNHIQPLQALYYDSTGKLCSFHINCFTGGFPNLNWNRIGAFNEFPPKQQAPVDTILNLEKHLSYFIPLQDTDVQGLKNYEYVVVVYWSKFMGRQSERLIEIVQQNALISDDSIKVIYINNDNLFHNISNN